MPGPISCILTSANLTKRVFFILFFKLPRCDMRVVPAVSNACDKGRGVLHCDSSLDSALLSTFGILGIVEFGWTPCAEKIRDGG